MAFPHPKSGNDHDWKEHKPGREGIAWKFLKRTIDIAQYRNAEDDVNRAEDRTFSGFFHDEFDLDLRVTPPHARQLLNCPTRTQTVLEWATACMREISLDL
jgi:hypothetical protein